MKTILTVIATVSVLYAIGKDEQHKKQIKDLEDRLERVGRFNDLYHATLAKTVKKLDGEERRQTIREFNENVDFIRITNHI